MQRVSSGYTIIEVLIFLAVSGFLILTSFIFLSGREGSNRFAQSMRDIQSKVQDWINDVPTGVTGGIDQGVRTAVCTTTGPPSALVPKINRNGGSTSPDCIFLGKAIQFTDSSSPPTSGQEAKVYVYAVFGSRTITPPAEDERLVGNLVEANPIAAVGVGSYSGNADLTETYKLGGGTVVKNIVKSSGVAGDNSHLGGFYLSFNPTSVKTNGSADLRAYQYTLGGPAGGNFRPGNISTNQVDECINLQAACLKPLTTPADQWPQPLTDWEICFQGSDGETALLTIASSGGQGITTKLDYKSC